MVKTNIEICGNCKFCDENNFCNIKNVIVESRNNACGSYEEYLEGWEEIFYLGLDY